MSCGYPSRGKVTAPECAADSFTFYNAAYYLPPVLHQNETDYLVVNKNEKNLQVSRYENGILKARDTVWEDAVHMITPDGYTVAMSTKFVSDLGQEGSLQRLPVASTALSLSRYVNPLVSLVPSLAGSQPLVPFLTSGLPQSHTMTLAIFDPALRQVGKSVYVGNICAVSGCYEYRPLFFRGTGDELHVVWVPDYIGKDFKWKYVLRSFSLKTGKSLGPARDLLKSEVYASSPVGDRIRDAIESPVLYSSLDGVWSQGVLYENLGVLAKTTFQVPKRDAALKRDYGNCMFGSIRMEVTTPSGKRTVEVFDEDLKKTVAPLCTRKINILYVNNYQLERRPGGGLFVVMSLNAGLHVRDMSFLGHFYREYTADGTPAGPVRKVDFHHITRLSDQAWRAESGCSWEVRSLAK